MTLLYLWAGFGSIVVRAHERHQTAIGFLDCEVTASLRAGQKIRCIVGVLTALATLCAASCASQRAVSPAPGPAGQDVSKVAKAPSEPGPGESRAPRALQTSAISTHASSPGVQALTRTSAGNVARTSPAQDESAAEAADLPLPGEPASETPYDPLSALNQKVLRVNVFFDDYVGRPAGMAWGWVVPYQARLHIQNFFRNTGEPKNLVNCMLQGRYRDAGITLKRFSVNSTLGIAGFFDVAHNWFGLDRQATDFGLTAAHHSVGYGPYLMTPGGGPTSFRDAAGRGVDGQFNPLSVMVYVLPSLVYLPISAGLGLIDAVNERSLSLDSFDDVNRYAVDLYGAVQDGYYQKRGHDQAAPGGAE
jgi:phospholipid-binding lipoprotein MlaA